jgi:nickel transport protein
MRPFFFLLGCLATVLLTAAAGWCHGVRGDVDQGNGYLITAEYDDGEPMNYAAVEIKAPDSTIVFQTGRTDRNGRFMIYPDQTGQWQAVVQDGMGHRLTLDLEVGGSTAAPESAHVRSSLTSGGMTRAAKVIAGLSIIFGLSGLLYGWKMRCNA